MKTHRLSCCVSVVWFLCLGWAGGGLLGADAPATGGGAPPPEVKVDVKDVNLQRARADFFEQKVRPLLADKCFSCHSVAADKRKGGLLLDSREAIERGGDSGPAALSGDPEASLLMRAVRCVDADLQMPPKEKLAVGEVAVLEKWIASGMVFPAAARAAGSNTREIDLEAGRRFWAFRPLGEVEVPFVRDTRWGRGRLDAFILAELEARGLQPAEAAPRATLLRRVKFDLLGLPPTPEEIEAFEADTAPDAYERRVEAFLSSPHLGERWGRHWLDLVRYCDVGESWVNSKGQPHWYRDWVIRSLNADMPYDRFLTLQLAADLLPDADPADRAALGFLGLSPNYWKELQLPVEIIKSIVSDEVEERMHTFSSVFLGVNLACARCHDHKYDPFTTEDYYGLAGVLASSRVAEQALEPGVDVQRIVALREQAAKTEEELKKLKAKKGEENAARITEMEEKLAALRGDPQFSAFLVTGVREGGVRVEAAKGKHGSQLVNEEAPRDLAVEIRGNPNRTGRTVPRRFPLLFTPEKPREFSSGSGRLELAQALVREGHSLVARVIVNRIWAAHFGTGLVNTPSEFGAQGEPPTHPALLEDLARRFVENGWSMKWLHREILFSSVYRQASGRAPVGDPGLRWYSRFPRKRLEVEPWRDALLCVSGTLDLTMGGPALDLGLSTNNRRTVYGLVKRRELNDLLRLHDFPDPVTHSPARTPTTTPLQQLFILNSPFFLQQAQALSKRLAAEKSDTAGRIERAYRLLYGRSPSASELRLGEAYLADSSDQNWTRYLQVLLGANEFLFTD